ncbi:MAG: proteasome lid subunit RPN8/RPN11 [Planctomycetota bacterium]|jgi:proteasome lid subunit RPN8/RPN11
MQISWTLRYSLSIELEREMIRKSLRSAPLEVCGLLMGSRTETCWTIADVATLTNLDDRPGRFRLDPLEHLATERLAQRLNRRILGAWHSHPSGLSRPSALDLAEMTGDWVCGILSVGGASGGQFSLWRAPTPGCLTQLRR